jgi:DNA polymerase-1
MTTWLLLDVSNLAHRIFHAVDSLSYGGEPTEVLFGVFRDMVELQDRYETNHIAFAFDGGIDKRKEIYPNYKGSRFEIINDMTEEQKEARRGLKRQIYRLRTKYLPLAGFKNIFWQEGYEADDVIASVCLESSSRDTEIIIVSSDSDLFQLLSPYVLVYNPLKKKIVTAKSFQDTHGVSPVQWADVKAIAGCRTDNIQGIRGIGDVSASKFISGTLPKGKKFDLIIEDQGECWDRNLKLVRLPFPGTEKFTLVDDEVTNERWNRVMKSLGMRSLMRGKVV